MVSGQLVKLPRASMPLVAGYWLALVVPVFVALHISYIWILPPQSYAVAAPVPSGLRAAVQAALLDSASSPEMDPHGCAQFARLSSCCSVRQLPPLARDVTPGGLLLCGLPMCLVRHVSMGVACCLYPSLRSTSFSMTACSLIIKKRALSLESRLACTSPNLTIMNIL